MTRKLTDNPNTARMTLRSFVEDVYIPPRIAAGHMQQSTATYYRNVCYRFEDFSGKGVLCRDITDESTDQFKASLIKRGYKPHTVRTFVDSIRVILRQWNPDRFPDLRGGPTKGPGGLPNRDIEGTLEQIFIENYLPERTSISAPGTIRQYERCLRLFALYLGYPPTPADLTDRTVGKFLRWQVEVEEIKPVTANAYTKQIKAIWTWLAKKRIVEQFPTIDKLKEPQRTPVAWTREEVQKIYAACEDEIGYMGPILSNLWWTAFYRVLWDTGERTGAMLALKWDWLDTKTGYLTVPGEFRKGRTQSMVYKLKKETIAALRAILHHERDLIFCLGQHRRMDYFYSRHRDLIQSAGVPFVSRKSGPQKMRRTFASYIEREGGNATKALRHRDRRVTEESYLDPRVVEIESENAKLFLLGGANAKGGA